MQPRALLAWKSSSRTANVLWLPSKSTRNLDGKFRKAFARLSALTSAVIRNSFLKYRAQLWPELALP